MTVPTHDPLDAALRAGDPARALTDGPEPVRLALADLLATSRLAAEHQQVGGVEPAPTSIATARAARARRLAVRAGALGAVVVVAGACVAAAAGFMDLHTGFFGSAGMSEEDTSEFLDISSPDLTPLVRSYAADLPLAPGFPLDPLIEQVHALGVRGAGADGSGGLMQADGIRSTVAVYSACTWDQSWLDAHAAGDVAAQERATEVIAAVPTWPILVRTAGDQGVVDSYRHAADAAAAGDTGAMQAYVDLSCSATR